MGAPTGPTPRRENRLDHRRQPGIGRATAEVFAAHGAAVIATDINPVTLAELAALDGVTARSLDVLDGAAVAAARRIGAVDVLWRCAGFVHHGSILDCDEAAWDFSFDLNVKAQYRVARAFLPAMIAAGGGSVINMSSVCSSVKGIVNRCVYGASKAAVIGLTKSIAADYIRDGIRCRVARARCSRRRLTRASTLSLTRCRRAGTSSPASPGPAGTAAEIADLALYLAGDAAAYTTGQAFVADGGISG